MGGHVVRNPLQYSSARSRSAARRSAARRVAARRLRRTRHTHPKERHSRRVLRLTLSTAHGRKGPAARGPQQPGADHGRTGFGSGGACLTVALPVEHPADGLVAMRVRSERQEAPELQRRSNQRCALRHGPVANRSRLRRIAATALASSCQVMLLLCVHTWGAHAPQRRGRVVKRRPLFAHSRDPQPRCAAAALPGPGPAAHGSGDGTLITHM